MIFALSNISVAKADIGLIVQGKNGDYVFNKSGNYFEASQIDDKAIDEFISMVAKKENRDYENAHYRYDKKINQFVAVKEKNGYKLRTEKLKEDITSALSVGGTVVTCQYDILKPNVLVKDLKGTLFSRAKFSTMHSENENRDSNIKLATESINGLRLKSGEVFSFNKVVGERTVERGYKESKIIVNGNFVEGVGGGVCQVSTTLYNAALLSGLEIVEYHQHTLKVGYVEPSFDAMVSGNSCDLKFKNNTNHDIFIIGNDAYGVLNFKIYGERQKSVFKRKSVIENEYVPEIKVIKTEKLKNGEFNVLSESKAGCLSKGYILEYSGKELINKRLIRKDSYAKVDKIVEIGCG